MLYKTILSTPEASLREMSYEKFAEMFKSVNEQIELLEAAQSQEIMLPAFMARQRTINQLEIAKQNLTMHRHYIAYCETQDRKHWDAVYHRPLL